MRTFSLSLASRAGLTGDGVRVAIIDSGVHATHPHVQGVAGGVGIDTAGVEHDDYVDRLGHGTAVAAVIREKAPAAEIFAIKVFDRELRSTGQSLVAALEWARRQQMRLVNLSLGTTNTSHEPALLREVRAGCKQRMHIVAAGPYGDTRWLPGSLPGVIAVELDTTLPRDVCEGTISDDGRVTIRACGYPRPIPGLPPERNLKGLSFAVANVSGLLALALEGTAPDEDICAALGSVGNGSSPSG